MRTKWTANEGVDWRRDALCAQVDPDLFFPTESGGYCEREPYAVAICRRCPVLRQCRAWVLSAPAGDDIWIGVAGGLTRWDRRQIRGGQVGRVLGRDTRDRRDADMALRRGVSVAEVARTYGVPSRTVQRWKTVITREQRRRKENDREYPGAYKAS